MDFFCTIETLLFGDETSAELEINKPKSHRQLQQGWGVSIHHPNKTSGTSYS